MADFTSRETMHERSDIAQHEGRLMKQEALIGELERNGHYRVMEELEAEA